MPDTATKPHDELLDDRYRIIAHLGQGSMGTVDSALDVHLARRVAIKRASAPSAAPGALGLMDEARALAAVRSTNVVAVHAFGHDATGRPFFVMEYVDGDTLETLIDRHADSGEPIPEGRAVQVLAAIAEGLGAVHAQGLVHRDVKPANIVVERLTGRAVLVDFGIAIGPNATPIDRLSRWGTAAYMSPEYSAGAEPHAAQDIYALGCVAFELLTGRVPYLGRDVQDVIERHSSEPTPLLSSARPESAHLEPVVARAMHKDPAQRFSTAAAFARALDAHRARPPVSAEPPSMDAASVDEASLRILVVDDDPDFLKIAARAARLAFADASVPLSISRAGSVAAALESMRRRRPDLVLLDHQLPDGTGIEFLTHLRDVAGGLRSRVLVVSAHAGEADQWRFRLLGADDFARKPADITVLLQRISTIARQQGWLPR